MIIYNMGWLSAKNCTIVSVSNGTMGIRTKTGESTASPMRSASRFSLISRSLHSKMSSIPRSEPRFYALGQTAARRLIFVVFTVRDELFRVISARDMTRRETRRYQREQK